MATYILTALNGSSEAVDSAVSANVTKENSHKIESGKWLLSSQLPTSKDLADTLGLGDVVTFLIAPIRGYHGRARPDIWEWLASKSNA